MTTLWWLHQDIGCVPGWWQRGGIPHCFGASALSSTPYI